MLQASVTLRNLIEGHNTHPVEIDRALAGDYSHDSRKRCLQLEARSHIEVQAMIDAHLIGYYPRYLATDIHELFKQAPDLANVHAELSKYKDHSLKRVFKVHEKYPTNANLPRSHCSHYRSQ